MLPILLRIQVLDCGLSPVVYFCYHKNAPPPYQHAVYIEDKGSYIGRFRGEVGQLTGLGKEGKNVLNKYK